MENFEGKIEQQKDIFDDVKFDSIEQNTKKLFDYEVFNSIKKRSEVFEFTKKIVDYIKENKIENIILVDRSARPMYVAINEYFKNIPDDFKKPKIYFANPNGFLFQGNLNGINIENLLFRQLKNDGVKQDYFDMKSENEVLENFKDTYRSLLENKEKPLLILDTCIHTGASINSIKNVLEKLNFSNIKTAIINSSKMKKDALIQPDLIVFDKISTNECYSFGEDEAVSKTLTSVTSIIDKNTKREYTRQLRNEIKNIIKSNLR